MVLTAEKIDVLLDIPELASSNCRIDRCFAGFSRVS